MKKHLIYLAVGAMALTACTSEDLPDVDPVQGNAIGFQNVINKSSRAVDGNLDNTTFTNFLVYGYYTKSDKATPIQIFNGVPVHKVVTTKEDGTRATKWEYDGTRYWIPNCKYYFYAYSCGDIALANANVGSPAFSLFDAGNTSVDNRALTIQQYLCDETHQHDLVTAENEGITATESGNPQVSLSFTHALCKVKAVFTTDFPEDYRVYLSNIRLHSFHNHGDYNVGTRTWTNYTGKDTDPYVNLSIPANSFVESGAGNKVETSEAFLIPKLYDTSMSENTKIQFTIDVKKLNPDGSEQDVLERTITGTWSPQWKNGFIYQYSILISGSTAGIEPIVFAAEQSLSGSESWDNSTQLNMIFGVDGN